MARGDQLARTRLFERALSETRRGLAIKRWAEDNGYGWRTVYRDLQALQRAGVAVIEPEPGRYRLDPEQRLKVAATLTSEEMLALHSLRQLAAPVKQTRLGRALDRVWSKVTADERQTRLLPSAAPDGEMSIRTWTPIDYARYHRVFETLDAAILERRAVVCTYRRLDGATTRRTIEPGQLHYDQALETVYVVAWCRLRRALRVFAVHRFLAARVSDLKVAMRPELRSEAAFKDAFRVWRDSKVVTVKVRLRGNAAAELRERRMHASQKLSELGDGAVEVSFEVAGLPELERWVLGYGADAMVLAPDELVQRVRAQVEGLALAYRVDAAAAKRRKKA